MVLTKEDIKFLKAQQLKYKLYIVNLKERKKRTLKKKLNAQNITV